MNIWIDRIKQKVMATYFFPKGYRSKHIDKELVSAFQDNAISMSTVKNWFRRFKSGDLSCGDEERAGTRLISLGSALQCVLKKFPFARAQIMAGHFSMDRDTIKSILDRELGFEKIHSQMSAPYPIGRTRIEKSNGIPKSVDHPSKPCAEKLSGNHYRR
jgi:hypothetical protein